MYEMSMTCNSPVTWLLPVRNGMPYLPLTLESIAAQTYTNTEIIAWDNNSTDDTLKELRRWIPRRIPGRIVSDRPMALGLSLAAMVNLAKTELCARIDADDINLPSRLEKQVAFLQAHPEVGMVGSQVTTIDQAGAQLERWRLSTADAEIRWQLRWKNPISHPSVLFRKSVILRAGNYRDCPSAEDFDLWLRVAELVEIRNLPEVLLNYRRSPASVMAGVTDHISIERSVMNKNVTQLFPNMPEPDATELWEATHPREPQRSPRLRHLLDLGRNARQFAKRVGKPPAYFSKTEIFLRQEDRIKIHLYQRMHLASVVRWRRGVR